MTLLEAKKGFDYTVKDLSAGRLTRRLLDMGFTPETSIFVAGIAPFGGTILVGIRGVLIALREDAACLINIELCKKGRMTDSVNYSSNIERCNRSEAGYPDRGKGDCRD